MIELYELDVMSPPPPSPPPPPNTLLWLDGEGGPAGAQTVLATGIATGKMRADLSSKAAAHAGKYGYEVMVTEVFAKNWHALLSLPAFLVTDHERMYTLTFWAKATANPHPRPQVTFQDEDAQYAYVDSAYVQLTSFWHQYSVPLAVPYRLRGHNIIANIMVGGYLGSYFFDDFQVTNKQFISPPPSPPSPPPSPPPHVLMQLSLESYQKGSINSQAWPEGEMHVTLQSTQAAHSGHYGILINVAKRFDQDWHAQVSLKGFTPPATDHGYIFSFWGRAAADHPGGRAMPKVVFQDADDSYTPLKQVSVPLTSSWQMYEVDISVPKYRQGHTIIISFWVGEYAGSYALDDFQVDIVAAFLPPPPPPPRSSHAAPPPPGVVALLGFEGTDDGVTSQRAANNGSWVVSFPDARAAHSGGAGLYVEVSRAWRVASLARLLLPRYVPRAGKEMLLHLAFWARVEKMHSTDPTPSVTVAFLDLHKNYEEIGSETITIPHSDWQMHYVVIDLKTEHVGHSIRPYLYIGKDPGIYYFDEFEYKEIEIEDGMAWLQRAPERIRRRRMGKFKLTFYDADDWPVDYGAAEIQLQRHRFSLGVDVKTRPMSAMSAADYLWYLRTAARHFWAGAIEHQMLWADYEPTPGDVSSGQKAVDDVITWSRSQNWGAIWATLLDGGHDNKDHWSNKLACKDLKQRLHERLARDISHFRGKIQLYEVWKGSLHWRDWIERCGEGLFFEAYRWAQQADPSAMLCSSEAAVLTTLTLTNAEAYHNLVYRLMDQGVPIKAVCVQAVFQGEIDASTVKHRLDVLNELQLPVYITEFAISGLDPAKHAYELEKFLRIAFSHDCVAGITLGEVWDRSASASHQQAISSGLYAANKQAKPAAARLDHLWRTEWTSKVQKSLSSDGSIDFDGFYGKFSYRLISDDGKTCEGTVDLDAAADDEQAPKSEWGARGAAGEAQTLIIKCSWKGRVHIPVWATPATLALMFVLCLYGCWRQKAKLSHRKKGHERLPTIIKS